MKILTGFFSAIFGILMLITANVAIFLLLLDLLPGYELIEIINILIKDTSFISDEIIFFLMTYGTLLTYILFSLASLFCFIFIGVSYRKTSKFINFFVSLLVISISTLILAETIFAFIVAKEIKTVGLSLTLLNKAGIGVCVFLYILIRLFDKKVNRIAERKIQAYENALEINKIGRSNPITANLLKTLTFIFPESVIVLLIAFLNKTLAPYFLNILIAVCILTLGAIWRDINIRRDIKRKNMQEKINQARAIAAILDGENQEIDKGKE